MVDMNMETDDSISVTDHALVLGNVRYKVDGS